MYSIRNGKSIMESMMVSWGYISLYANQNEIVSSAFNLELTGKTNVLSYDEMTFMQTSRGDVPSINVLSIGTIINCIRLNLMAIILSCSSCEVIIFFDTL